MLTAAEVAAVDAVDGDAAVALLSALVRAKSVWPANSEEEAAQVVARYLEAAGIETTLDYVQPGRPNVLARLGRGNGPTLLWNAHLDTVPPGNAAAWASDPFGAEVRDGKLYGRGASDDKGGVAVMAAAAAAVAKAGAVDGTLKLSFVVGEETGHVGTRAAIKRGLTADLAVVGEWSGAHRIGLGYRGALWLAIETKGRAAHGSRPARGLNAIDMMTQQVLPKLKATPLQFERDPLFLIQEPSWNVGTIEGGVGTNVVADRCRATIDLRIVPGQDPAVVLELLREQVRGLKYPGGEPAPVEITVLNAIGPFVTPREHAVAATLASSIRDVLGVDPEYFGKTGVSDANVLSHEASIPSLAYGPGNASGHEPNENVELSELVRCTRVLAVSALRACATG